MKIFAISDLHLTTTEDKPMDIFGMSWVGHWDKIKTDWLAKVTTDDIVLIAGDVSWAMNAQNALSDLTEIDKLPGKKIIIRGNHDYWWTSFKKLSAMPLNSIFFIQNNAIRIDNYVFCGTRGWMVPESDKQGAEDKKIFDREVIRLKLTLEEGKKLYKEGDKIIAMIHFPPFNSRFDNSSLTELFALYNVDKVIYGHLHGENGRYKAVVNKGSTDYYLTSCDFLNNSLLQIY